MKLFNFRKKKKILDLTEKYRKDQEKIQSDTLKEPQSSGAFDIFGNSALGSSSETQSNDTDVSGSVLDKRRKFAKRFLDITNKMEDLSNQIYHLEQRIEVLEKKDQRF
jgi:hypothetical protein